MTLPVFSKRFWKEKTMPKKNQKPEPKTLKENLEFILSALIPWDDEDANEMLTALGMKRTGSALVALGVFLKAAKGDTSAAKFIKELEGDEKDEATLESGLENLSTAVLMKLAGL